MKAIRCERLGGPEVLAHVDVATPEPAAREVLVQVEAAGVNFSDGAVVVTCEGLHDQLRDATNGRGFDVVLDSDGGEFASALFDSLAPFGRLVSFDVASGMPLARAAESHAAMDSRMPIGKTSLSVGGVEGREVDAAKHRPGRTR